MGSTAGLDGISAPGVKALRKLRKTKPINETSCLFDFIFLAPI